jgi:hypothetical protein
MRGVTLCLVALLLATATGTAIATDNTPPLAAAGLDQTVAPGTTVYLDANGSTDPDGEIASVNWTVEMPDGTTQPPDCGTCRQTHFEATTLGDYTVTLSVTDDDGATSSDTLYVTVEDEDGPSVSLSGPTTASPGSSTTFTASADSANASLQSVSWVVDGDVVSQNDVSGDTASSTLTQSFGSADNATVRAVVYDTLGYRGSASQTVSLNSGGGGGDGSGCDDSDTWDGYCNGGADAQISIGNQTQFLNSNGREGIQTVDQEEGMVSYEEPTTSSYISMDDRGNYIIDDSVSAETALEDTRTAQDLNNSDNGSSEDGTSIVDSNSPDNSDADDKNKGGSPPSFGNDSGGK